MAKKEEERYEMTLRGLIFLTTKNETLTGEIIDAIELHMRRHYAKDGVPGIVLDPDTNKLSFVTLNAD